MKEAWAVADWIQVAKQGEIEDKSCKIVYKGVHSFPVRINGEAIDLCDDRD